MNLLRFIWELSLVLAGAALAIMLGLIAARIVSDRRARRREAQRRTLVPVLLGARELEPRSLEAIAPDVIADVSTKLIGMVRGVDREAFVSRAETLGVPQRLARLLRSGSSRRRLAAAQAIGAFHDPNSLRVLRDALADSNDDVRLAAALSLASAGDTLSAAEQLSDLRLGTHEPSLLMITLFKRIAADRPDHIKALVLDPEAHVHVRVSAIEALAATGDYSLVPVIADLALAAADGAEELPRYLHALGQLGHPAARQAVLDGLRRPDMAARAAAASAAGRIGLVEAAETLASMLDDSEWWVRFRAAESLIGFGEDGRRRLREAAGSGTPRAQDAARKMLAERGLEP